ncbi:MAG TPA: Spy/CpxP family protein refolding chaperone [Bryobacteraceae bacterium]|nr:Spy/CpxP family protein refolding chaperone [Bryobacteraceae bacterium]
MKIIPKRLITLACAGALTSIGLFASVSPATSQSGRQDRFVNEIETVLAMTPQQKDQAQTAIEGARQSANPIRQELMNTNKELRTAVRSDDSAAIQRLSSTEGQEIGQLLAIRSSAVANVYKVLTPNQRARADALHQILMRGVRQEMAQ